MTGDAEQRSWIRVRATAENLHADAHVGAGLDAKSHSPPTHRHASVRAYAEGGHAHVGVRHPAAHRGELIEDAAVMAFDFRHADGSAYGRVGEPRMLEARAKTFSAMRNLGFREGDVRSVPGKLR